MVWAGFHLPPFGIMRIIVSPEELRQLAAQCRQVAQELTDLQVRLQRAWHGLDWEVRRSYTLESEVAYARRLALNLGEQAEDMSRFLLSCAAAFEEADMVGASQLAQTVQQWQQSAPPLQPLAVPAFFLQQTFRTVQSLGGWIVPPHLPFATVEPQEQGALLHFSLDQLLKYAGLGLLTDVLDVARLPEWTRNIEEATNTWKMAASTFGTTSAEAQWMYRRYLETLVFKMPLVGNKVEAFLSILKVLGRMNPVE